MGLMDAVEEEAEELFPPRPGGLVDRHRKRMADRDAAAAIALNTAEGVEKASYAAVKVAQESPELIRAITFTLPPGGYAPVLPYSPYRHRATLLVITSGTTVVLADTSGNAISQSGFTLPYGIPVTLLSRAMVYAYNNTAVTVQVSVIAEIYAAQK